MFRIVAAAALALIVANPPAEGRPRLTRAVPAPQILGGRPAGCPHAFCGCGASLYLFGRIIPRLNLAARWFDFPRARPAPRMAAVRQHHVFVLVEQIEAGTWLAHDSNSGGGLTRLHARSLAGYVIVDPSEAK
ncbi:hypothetical protein JQ633_12665 [Bradyrhizobium tropiciagri]|uniref:hypothetical protein n=1 Tax=Bradyrhizobium tropiciagri TaxID=312253 RepID=UPI001BAC5683|nr:hypothetical protein [Bradyrhizobium tropiciagri]MBR0871216.1 hypothetical protein [Bradyrhizobium tropiciagri]